MSNRRTRGVLAATAPSAARRSKLCAPGRATAGLLCPMQPPWRVIAGGGRVEGVGVARIQLQVVGPGGDLGRGLLAYQPSGVRPCRTSTGRSAACHVKQWNRATTSHHGRTDRLTAALRAIAPYHAGCSCAASHPVRICRKGRVRPRQRSGCSRSHAGWSPSREDSRADIQESLGFRRRHRRGRGDRKRRGQAQRKSVLCGQTGA